LLSIALNLLLVGRLQHGGLALATSVASVASAGTLLVVLSGRVRKVSGGRLTGIGGRAILDSLWRVVLTSLLMGAAVWVCHGWLVARVLGASVAAQALRLFGAVGVGVVVYAVLAFLLRVPEAQTMWRLAQAVPASLRGRLRRRSGGGVAQ
jgi:putative peptidoglycan lipid II flippase